MCRSRSSVVSRAPHSALSRDVPPGCCPTLISISRSASVVSRADVHPPWLYYCCFASHNCHYYSVEHAKKLDKINGNTLWQDAISKELAELDEYKTFLALRKGDDVPEDYTRIPYRIVFDVKYDLRWKARLVAGGHRTDVPSKDTQAVYRSTRLGWRSFFWC